MKAIIILDQIQAGLGGKERADTPLGGKKLAMGSAENVAHALSASTGKSWGPSIAGRSITSKTATWYKASSPA